MINSIGGSSGYMPRPDGAKMANKLFSALDTKQQGYLEKSDLQAAADKLGSSGKSTDGPSVDEMFSQLDGDGDGKVTKDEMSSSLQKMAQELDSQFQQMRTQGMTGAQGFRPPPPPDQGNTQQMAEDLFSALDTKNQGYIEKSDLASALGTASSSSSQQPSVDELFAQWDSNSDGQVTKDELAASLQSQRPDGPPPGPPPGMGGPQGQTPPELSKDELTSMAEKIGSTDSQRSEMIKNLVGNFDKADSDGNGKISAEEAMSFAKSSKTSDAKSTSSEATGSSSEARALNRMMQLMRAYTATATGSANSTSISVAA